jgi:5'-nucleotidase
MGAARAVGDSRLARRPGQTLAAGLLTSLLPGLAATTAAASTAAPPPLCGRGPLEILLTNDDGVDAVGVRALAAGLAAAGHRVLLAAPDHNASGTAMSFAWGDVRVRRDPDDPAVHAVSASPATAVVLAATALYPPGRRPDLVVSGINHGPNSGALLMLSGTVGAAMAGTLLLDPPVPGIAVNAERLRAAEPVDSPANRAHYQAVGADVPGLIAAARGWFCGHGRVQRARTVLNVNYPARPLSEMRGTVVTRQGSATDLRVTFEATASGAYQARTSRAAAPDRRDTDNSWLRQGYVTVTPVSGLIDDDRAHRGDLAKRLRPLQRAAVDQSPRQR